MAPMARNGLWVLAFVVLTILAAGCGGKSDTVKVKISSWGDVQENAILSELIKSFEKTHPHIKVELQRIPHNDYITKLLTQIASGDAPDVVFRKWGISPTSI